MAFWDGVGGAAAGSIIDAGASFGSQAWSQDFAKEMYKHRYQWAVKDMRKAGLNPVLASGMNPATPSAPPGRGLSGTAQAITSAKVGKEQVELLKRQQREALERTVNLRLQNAELGRYKPMWDEQFKVHNSNYGRRMNRLNTQMSIGLDRAAQLKDLVNPFTGRGTPRLGK